MTDGGAWQPPRGGDGVPPPPPPTPGDASPPAATPGGGTVLPPPAAPAGPPDGPLDAGADGELDGPDRPRSKGVIIGAAVAAVVLIAAGVFAISRLTGDSTAGGAESPEEAGLALLAALENEDVLGMIDVMLPGERETMRGPATDLVDELRRIDVLSDDASLSDVGGVDIILEDESVTVDATNVDDIVNVEITAAGSATVDGERLPIGELILDNLDADMSELDVTEPGPAEPATIPLTAVRHEGRWYLSLFHTAAETMRAQAGITEIPVAGIDAVGGDSPEAAVDAFLAGVEELDLAGMLGALNPDEFQALHRYAPLFLDDAQAELDQLGARITVDDVGYSVSGSDDTRSVAIESLRAEATVDGDTATLEYADGCLVAESGTDRVDTCELADQMPDMDETFGDSAPAVENFLDTAREAFADYDNPGFIVKRVDGRWYLSPMATGAEQMLAFLRALERDEIEQVVADGQEAFNAVAGQVLGDAGVGSGTDPFDLLPTDDEAATTVPAAPSDTVPTDDTVPTGDTVATGDTVPTDASLPADDDALPDESSAGDECFAEETGADAAACYQALLDDGAISPSAVPVYLRAPQCGLADVYWSGEFFSLSDAEFTAAVSAAAPCFQELVDSGEIADFELPLELSDPECLDGRNWYTAPSEDEEYIDAVLDCAYG